MRCVELKGGAFSKVQWTQDSPATLYAVINLSAKSEGYLVQYEMVCHSNTMLSVPEINELDLCAAISHSTMMIQKVLLNFCVEAEAC